MSKVVCNSKGLPVAEIIPNFATEVLEFDPNTLISTLHSQYPVRKAGDALDEPAGEPQWVHGSHDNLKYRGHSLRRMKMWFQQGSTDEFVKIYSYTGFQYGIVSAQFDVDKVPPLAQIMTKYNQWVTKVRQHIPLANHGIVTEYENGHDNIGMHFDKPQSLDPDTLISVIKLGPGSRPFRIEERDDNNTVLFDQVLDPGTAVVMTMDQNLATKHGVPVCDCKESSGSIVFRTARREERISKVQKRANETNERRAARRIKG